MNEAVRLSKKDLQNIKICFLKHFGPSDHLWLFGSRVNPLKKGGDIDLYVETHEADPKIANDHKINFVNNLWLTLGDQKIDVVLNLIQTPIQLPIYEIAKKTGIQLQ
jgi:predicted nucleotidyltransferase